MGGLVEVWMGKALSYASIPSALQRGGAAMPPRFGMKLLGASVEQSSQVLMRWPV